MSVQPAGGVIVGKTPPEAFVLTCASITSFACVPAGTFNAIEVDAACEREFAARNEIDCATGVMLGAEVSTLAVVEADDVAWLPTLSEIWTSYW